MEGPGRASGVAAHRLTVQSRSGSTGCVFQHGDTVRTADLSQRRYVGRHPALMDSEHGPRPCGECRSHGLCSNVSISLVYIREDRSGSEVTHDVGCGNETKRGYDDFVTRLN